MDYVWDMEEHMVDIHIDTSSRHFKSWETFRIGDFFHIIKEKLGLPWIPHKDCDEYLSRVRNAYVHLKEGLFIPLYILSLSENDRRKSLDEQNEAHVGDTVRIVECSPISKDKCWRLAEIVERAK